MVALHEKYRPQDFTDVVGQDNVMLRLHCLMKTCGLEGQVYWLVGDSATGKTTLARLIANATASDFTTIEIDAQDVSMDLIRDWEAKAQYRSLYGGYAFIINEAHGLSNKAVSRLQTVLDDAGIQKNSTWIFTTTKQGEEKLFGDKFDALPFMSRATCFELASGPETMMEFARRAQWIAQQEGVDGKPLEAYVELLTDCGGNLRAALNRIASGEMLGGSN